MAKSKYKNKKFEIDNIKLDSKLEAEYYLYLKGLKEKGKIKDFTVHQKFLLQPSYKKYGKNIRAITYAVDFSITYNNGTIEHIDTKGMATKDGELKRKMFDYLYPSETLKWISKSIKYGDENGWIEYDKLKKLRAESKKTKAKDKK